MSSKKKYPTFTTPVGVAIYPRLNKPDTKYKAEGEYSVKLRLSPEDVPAEMIEAAERLTKELAEETLKGKPPALKKQLKIDPTVFAPELDKETGDETGYVVANFKMKAKGEKKDGTPWTRKPALFDAKGKPTKVDIWGGSTIKVNFELVPYYSAKDKIIGVTRYMNAVQVIELVSGGERNASSFGFGEEDGWTDDGSAGASEDTETADVASTDAEDCDF